MNTNKIDVCIVDDDEIYQYTMKLNLRGINSVGHTRIFNDGLEAIDFIVANQHSPKILPDIIFLDINMPIMDGFEFMEEFIKIKPKLQKKITTFMVSSSVDTVDVVKSKQIHEIADYIVKPITRDQLKTILERLPNN